MQPGPGLEEGGAEGYYCPWSLTYDQADLHCKALGAELCTEEELNNKCAKSTGCKLNGELVWARPEVTDAPTASPTKAPTKAPTDVPSNSPSMVCGRADNTLPDMWTSSYGYDAPGYWEIGLHPRFVKDVDGDGLDDVVGFSNYGVKVSLSTGCEFVDEDDLWLTGAFLPGDGWNEADHPRLVEDVNNDGLADVIGFASDGVYVALSTGTAFTSPTKWINDYGNNQGWTTTDHLRFIEDVNGDGLKDIVGFSDGIFVSLSNGSSFGPATRWIQNAFGKSSRLAGGCSPSLC